MLLSKRLLCIYFTIGVLVMGLSECSNLKEQKYSDIRGLQYADQQTCVKCHSNVTASFSETSHFHTSSQMKDVKEFPEVDNTFAFNESLKVVIEERNNRKYQVAYFNNQEIEAHQFDIAFGSGEKAITFAYWEQNNLFQLPLTYYKSINKWTNSPGFPEDRIHYQKSTFAFQPGDTLSDYYYPQYTRSWKEPDVHGNQHGMLASSACFIQSEMDCSSCHNTHVTEKNNPALFSQRCVVCHTPESHPLATNLGTANLTKNCIDCHMPVQPSKLITFQLAGKTHSPDCGVSRRNTKDHFIFNI